MDCEAKKRSLIGMLPVQDPVSFTERVFAPNWLIIYEGNFTVLVLRVIIHREVWFVIEAGTSSLPGPLIEY